MNLPPILTDWLHEQARQNGTTKEWELRYALANYIKTVDPDYQSGLIDALLARLKHPDAGSIYEAMAREASP